MILIMYHKCQYFIYKINQSYFSRSESDSYLWTEEVLLIKLLHMELESTNYVITHQTTFFNPK